MGKNVLVLATNYGLWAEELQAPWDALRKAPGISVTLATRMGKTPLPFFLSMDPEFIDPLQNYKVNPKEVVDRVNEILDAGEWDNPIRIEDANMDDYDAIVIVGGVGASLDLNGNQKVHRLVLSAYKSGKVIGALCYAVGSLLWTRDPENGNKSILRGRRVVAHPASWDFDADMPYTLVRATPDNKGTDLVTTGFVYPLQVIVEDGVGPDGKVFSDPTTNRERPLVVYDHPFVTGLSVESSIAFGQKLVEVLAG
ncbi:MAG: type 1 glutamine amidotransferase domain-containing protein [Gemmatimonadetes bacterium]|nr:type 1 glutamine amidotransferase domain-containing protein [Gemmatimonadota bacterium]